MMKSACPENRDQVFLALVCWFLDFNAPSTDSGPRVLSWLLHCNVSRFALFVVSFKLSLLVYQKQYPGYSVSKKQKNKPRMAFALMVPTLTDTISTSSEAIETLMLLHHMAGRMSTVETHTTDLG